MPDHKALPLFARFVLWFAAVTAALTGFWLAPATFLNSMNTLDVRHWAYAVGGLFLLVAGIVDWARLVSTEPRREFVRVAQTVVVTLAVFAAGWMTVGIIGVYHRTCLPGETNGPAAITWLAPAIAYYSLGYLGFARSRRLRLIWPLAVIAAVLVLLAVELIWTTGSGCGD